MAVSLCRLGLYTRDQKAAGSDSAVVRMMPVLGPGARPVTPVCSRDAGCPNLISLVGVSDGEQKWIGKDK